MSPPYATEILAALDTNNLDEARDGLLRQTYELVGDQRSWDSPQYTTAHEVQRELKLDTSRDTLFPYPGLATIVDRYMLRGPTGELVETPQDFWARIATGIAMAGFRDEGHLVAGEAYFTMGGKRVKRSSVVRYAQKLYDAMSRHWFIPATPILTNIGTKRALPISCFLSTIEDSMEGITGNTTENMFISKGGGGIGNYWGHVRHRGAKLGTGGKSSGIVPFLKIQDAYTMAVNQGGARRGASAAYLPVWHPEIEEFIEIRKPTGGDENRRCMNLNHGVVIDDAFMEAVLACQPYSLRCPKTNEVVREVDAFDLFNRILSLRVETGEPYLLFIDNVNRAVPTHHRQKGLYVETSNLCIEITLPTAPDRTAVCCLGSMNLEHYDEWKDDKEVVYLAVRALDNVLQAFVNQADGPYDKAKRSAEMERSVGLGVMGYHGLLMQKGLPFESVPARLLNRQVFKLLHTRAIAASKKLGQERGVCPDAEGTDFDQRNSYVMAIAPTASIGIIGGATPCIEPQAGNAYTQKTLSGSFLIKNRYLEQALERLGLNTPEVWKSIVGNDGSVLHLEGMDDDQKKVFRTAWEINQREIVTQAADRQPFVCQSQSLNLFFDSIGGISRKYLFDAHVMAWQLGVKSLYYLRSRSVLRSDSTERAAIVHRLEGEECAVCQ